MTQKGRGADCVALCRVGGFPGEYLRGKFRSFQERRPRTTRDKGERDDGRAAKVISVNGRERGGKCEPQIKQEERGSKGGFRNKGKRDCRKHPVSIGGHGKNS